MISPGQMFEFLEAHPEAVGRIPVRTYRPRIDRRRRGTVDGQPAPRPVAAVLDAAYADFTERMVRED